MADCSWPCGPATGLPPPTRPCKQVEPRARRVRPSRNRYAHARTCARGGGGAPTRQAAADPRLRPVELRHHRLRTWEQFAYVLKWGAPARRRNLPRAAGSIREGIQSRVRRLQESSEIVCGLQIGPIFNAFSHGARRRTREKRSTRERPTSERASERRNRGSEERKEFKFSSSRPTHSKVSREFQRKCQRCDRSSAQAGGLNVRRTSSQY